MSLLTRRLLLACVLGLTVLAQPGLCPCWLIPNVKVIHPHPAGNANQPHGHDYLFEMLPAYAAVIANLAVLPAWALILLLGMAGLWRRMSHVALSGGDTAPRPPFPPPRHATSLPL